MHRLKTRVFFTLAILLLGNLTNHAGAELVATAIIPKPANVRVAEGRFAFNEGTVVVAGGKAEAEGRKLAAWLRAATGLPLPFPRSEPASNFLQLELDSSLAPALGDEGYTLSVRPDRIVIRAAGEAGLLYGSVTLGQLLPPEIFATRPGDLETRGTIAWTAPCIEIEDKPRFVWRGLLLDVARHYLPVEFLKKAVDLLALHKMNTLQLHLTDDQGWRLESRKYPRLTQVGSIRKESPRRGDRARGDGTPYGPFFYTQEQLRSLVEYAQARHVTIVPEIEMPGHFMAALAAYPEYSCRGGPFEVRTQWGVEPDILCAGNEQAVSFAQDILAEVMDLFPSRFIHIGGDEAPRDRWKECPKCQARIQSRGLNNEAELQTDFNHRIEQFLQGKGRRLIGWDEILEGGLTPGAAVMSWRGMSGGIAAASAGHDVVMSPTSHCYFDYAQSKSPGEPESIGGYIPLRTVYAFEPVPPGLASDKQRHILGGQGNVWSEFLRSPKDVEYFAFPRAVALAEALWSPAPMRDYDEFCRRLELHLKRLEMLQVNYRGLDAGTD